MARTWPVIMCFCACDSLVYMQHSWSQPFAQSEDILSVECLWFIVSASHPLSHVCSVNTAGAASSCVVRVCLSVCVCVFLSKSRARSARGHKLMELMLICGRQAWHYTDEQDFSTIAIWREKVGGEEKETRIEREFNEDKSAKAECRRMEKERWRL